MTENRIATTLIKAWQNCKLTPEQMLQDIKYRRTNQINSSWVLDDAERRVKEMMK